MMYYLWQGRTIKEGAEDLNQFEQNNNDNEEQKIPEWKMNLLAKKKKSLEENAMQNWILASSFIIYFPSNFSQICGGKDFDSHKQKTSDTGCQIIIATCRLQTYLYFSALEVFFSLTAVKWMI